MYTFAAGVERGHGDVREDRPHATDEHRTPPTRPPASLRGRAAWGSERSRAGAVPTMCRTPCSTSARTTSCGGSAGGTGRGNRRKPPSSSHRRSGGPPRSTRRNRGARAARRSPEERVEVHRGLGLQDRTHQAGAFGDRQRDEAQTRLLDLAEVTRLRMPTKSPDVLYTQPWYGQLNFLTCRCRRRRARAAMAARVDEGPHLAVVGPGEQHRHAGDLHRPVRPGSRISRWRPASAASA